jgi:hypothetical protein
MGPPAMLYNGTEDESCESRTRRHRWVVEQEADIAQVPAQEVIDLAEEPSQFLAADVPDAFKPESLATIESQCRNFLRQVHDLSHQHKLKFQLLRKENG